MNAVNSGRTCAGQSSPALSKFLLSTLLASTIFITGCGIIPMPGSKEGPKPAGGTPVGTMQPQDGSGAPMIAGYWKINYTVNGRPMVASVKLNQAGAQFEGGGSDDHNNAPFNIADGKITKGGDVRFFKKYAGKKSAPVEYTGKLRMVDANGYKGPYLEGEYVTAYNGNIIQGKWEAQQAGTADPPPPNPADYQQPAQNGGGGQQQMQPDPQPMQEPQQSQQPQQTTDPSRAPHLSGKWNTGYMYHGKTVHSKMYLEQEAGKVWGHGTDDETKEKYSIKGWYSFPKLQFVRKYEKNKGAKANRELTFRANVTIVNDGSYSGPYLEGETTLGERWEAQAFR